MIGVHTKNFTKSTETVVERYKECYFRNSSFQDEQHSSNLEAPNHVVMMEVCVEMGEERVITGSVQYLYLTTGSVPY